jgi:excisionase family DNA binding protein
MTKLIKPTDLARELSVSRAWIYAAAQDGRIPSVRIGGEDGPLRFVPEDVERWLDAAREAWMPGGRSVATRGWQECLPRSGSD